MNAATSSSSVHFLRERDVSRRPAISRLARSRLHDDTLKAGDVDVIGGVTIAIVSTVHRTPHGGGKGNKTRVKLAENTHR